MIQDNRILEELDGRRTIEEVPYIPPLAFSVNKTKIMKNNLMSRETLTNATISTNKNLGEFSLCESSNKTAVSNTNGAIADSSMSSGLRLLANIQTNNTIPTICQVSIKEKHLF